MLFRSTRAYWTKCRSELTDMITQLGSPTLFFSLSAVDTKWPDLHTLMPGNLEGHALNAHRRNIDNVVNYPHVVVMYMHHRFSIFREEVLENIFVLKIFGTASSIFFISRHTFYFLLPISL